MSLLLRIVLGSTLLGPVAGRAQPAPAASPDSVRPHPARHRVVVQYDSRYAILNQHLTTINGLKLGVEFKNRFRGGGALYFLSTGVPTRQARPTNAAEGTAAQLRFRYLAAYGDYLLLNTPRWELSTNLLLGLGSSFVRYTTPDGTAANTPREFLGVVEPSVATQLRVFHWAGLGAGAGWRQPIFVPAPIRRELDGPVFYLRAKLFLGDLLKVIKNKEPLFTQQGLRRE